MVAALPEGIPLLQYVELRAGDDTPSDEEQLAIAVMCNRGAIVDLFHSWDLDRDGVVSPSEFEAAMRELGLRRESVSDATIQAMFRSWDRNGNGSLSIEELASVLNGAATIMALRTSLSKHRESLQRLFKGWDFDGNGEISRESTSRIEPLVLTPL